MKYTALVIVVLWVAFGIGWVMNVWAFCHLDFKEPYKAEILRGIGIPLGPMGGIEGYLTFDEERK